MYNSTASQFMDKQIMDLSNSQNSTATNSTDFIDFLRTEKKEDTAPSYDFMPIRPAVGSSSPSATRSLNFDSGEDDAPIRTWNSLDSKKNASPIRNYNSLDADEPAKFVLGKSHEPVNTSSDLSLVSEIDRTMKKYVDDLMHAMDGLSARLSHLETKTHNVESSMDELKVSLGNNHGSTDGKIRQLANVLREVQTGVQFIKDKQEVVEGQFDIAKLIPKAEQEVQSRKTPHIDSPQHGVPSYQQFSTNSLTQTANAPPPPSPLQNLQPQLQVPNQFPQNQAPSAPQPEAYFTPPDQTPNQYQIPPPQHHQPPPVPPPQGHQPPPQHPYPPPPQPQHPYPPPPQPQYPPTPPPPSQPHLTFSTVNPSQPQPQLGHPPEEPPYTTPQTYPQPTHPSPPSQQFYGPTHPGYSPPFGPTSSHGEPYPNYSSSTSPYSGGSPRKPQQSGGSGYPQIPTARILPQAAPTAASGTRGGSGSGNRVPVDDVVDKVTNMGFSREQVMAAVQRLTEDGQAVDLNVVLDKLMNDGDVQAPRGWYGR